MTKDTVIIGPSTLVTHSRIRDPAKPGQTFSEVWNAITTGAKARARQRSVDLEILSPTNYYDPDEFLGLVDCGVSKRPQNLILPFTPVGSSREKKFLNILDLFDGRIIAVNVPPNKTALDQLGSKFIAYTGMQETRAGEMAAEQLLLRTGMRYGRIVVLVHEKDHFALSLRIQGIREVAKGYNIPVEEVYIGTEKTQITLPFDEKCGIITLGNRGTEAALTINPGQVVGITAIDLNDTVAEAIWDSRVICTLIQHPYYQGVFAINASLERVAKRPMTYACGPTLVDQNNVLIFKKTRTK